MSDQTTIGDLVAAFLEACQVDVIFGVISIHNMPILDAVGRRGAVKFIPARGEAGAANMADAYARVTKSLGVVVTSTGTAAGNAAGAMVEAQTAGTPLLHITGQIETPYLDRDKAYIHEARDQLTMLKSVSKKAYRVTSADQTLGILREAVQTALSAPAGPVSIEIPIDIQASKIDMPETLECLSVIKPSVSGDAIDQLADRLADRRRALLWLGGGARHAVGAVGKLADMGFGVVTSTQGRGVLAESDPRTLGALNMSQPVEKFYATCDAMLIAGSRLRGNETLKYSLKLPAPLFQIDADPGAEGRNYPVEHFICGDTADVLEGLVERLAGRFTPDPEFHRDLKSARDLAEADMINGLGPYGALVAGLQAALPEEFVWVRDVTISNSTWGNRLLKIFGPYDGVHALGGGIGQGLAMGIGAAAGAGARKTVCLAGDGGFQLNLGELATAVQEQSDMLIILMNSQGYGVIKNIQDAHYGGRHYYVDLPSPDFADIAKAMGMPHRRVSDLDDIETVFAGALNKTGPSILEIDMPAIGDFSQAFAGPPARAKKLEKV